MLKARGKDLILPSIILIVGMMPLALALQKPRRPSGRARVNGYRRRLWAVYDAGMPVRAVRRHRTVHFNTATAWC